MTCEKEWEEMRRAEMRWHQVRRNQMIWDEMTPGMWSASAKCVMRGVKCAVWSVKKFEFQELEMWKRSFRARLPSNSTLLNSSPLYSTQLYSAQLYSAQLYSTLVYPTLVNSTRLFSAQLYSNLLNSTLLYSTLLDSTLLFRHMITGLNDLLRHMENWTCWSLKAGANWT